MPHFIAMILVIQTVQLNFYNHYLHEIHIFLKSLIFIVSV